MENISFLVGSGFSVPAGYPTTKDLNERFSKIDASEICIQNDGFARFLDGESDPNPDMRPTERRFVQEFLRFYSDKALRRGQSFHYETFYDYYSDALNWGKYPKVLVSFLDIADLHCLPSNGALITVERWL